MLRQNLTNNNVLKTNSPQANQSASRANPSARLEGVVDPHSVSEKQTRHSPNNWVMSEGEFNKKTNAYEIKIEFNGIVVDETGKYGKDELSSFASRIQKQMMHTLNNPAGKNKTTKSGKKVVFISKVNIRYGKEKDIKSHEHVFRISPPDRMPGRTKDENGNISVPYGLGYAGSKVVYINDDIVKNEMDTSGVMAGTGLTKDGEATLERTAVHEALHTHHLYHPEETPTNEYSIDSAGVKTPNWAYIPPESFDDVEGGKNIMHQSKRDGKAHPQAGLLMTQEQLYTMYKMRASGVALNGFQQVSEETINTIPTIKKK